MKRRFDRVLVHIGAPKTGTTSIQHFLVANREALMDRGFYIPSAGRRGVQHIELPLLFGRRRERLDLHAGTARGVVESDRAKLFDALAAEMAAVARGHTLLVFSEHMFAPDPAAIDAYRTLFAPYVARFESLMYLRRQDRWIASQALQSRKTGARGDIGLEPRATGAFERTIRLWDSRSDRCVIRRFDPDFLAGGSLIEDFCLAIGCDHAGLAAGEVRNSALTQEQFELVDALNRALAMPFGRQIAYRSRFLDLCGTVLGGTRFEFARGAAEATFAAYAPINTWLRETRDPDGPPLFFNADFSDYPEAPVNDRTYSTDDLLRLAAAIDGRLRDFGREPARAPAASSRAAIVAHIVSRFIALHECERGRPAELSAARAVR